MIYLAGAFFNVTYIVYTSVHGNRTHDHDQIPGVAKVMLYCLRYRKKMEGKVGTEILQERVLRVRFNLKNKYALIQAGIGVWIVVHNSALLSIIFFFCQFFCSIIWIYSYNYAFARYVSPRYSLHFISSCIPWDLNLWPWPTVWATGMQLRKNGKWNANRKKMKRKIGNRNSST